MAVEGLKKYGNDPLLRFFYGYSLILEGKYITYTYLDLVLPVALGATGDEKSPFVYVTGDPACFMHADTHFFHDVFLECALPCLLPPSLYHLLVLSALRCRRTFLSAVGGYGQPFSLELMVVTMSWSRSMPALLITSSFVAWSRHEMIVHWQGQWKTFPACDHCHSLPSLTHVNCYKLA